jgi:beta-glucanase (GH16 family)
MKTKTTLMTALIFSGIAGAFLLHASRADDSAPPSGAPEKWKLVWSDDFNYTGLPDPAKWTYEEGFVRNKESQYYTANRKENARVENGELILEARKEIFPNAHYDPAGKTYATKTKEAQYTSASITTSGKFSWKYGRFICCAKVPGSHGCWPAFWMLGENHHTVGWPACGEIDTMEWFSQRPAVVKGSVLFINKNNKFQSVSLDHKTTPAPADDFHTYETRWYPDRIDIYVDDVKYNTMHIDDAQPGDKNAFRKPMYLLLNLAMGSTSGAIDDSKLPAKYEIKYVKVYQLEGK